MWKLIWRPLSAFKFNALKALNIKILNFEFELEEKLDQYFDVKFDEESEFYSLESEKSSHL